MRYAVIADRVWNGIDDEAHSGLAVIVDEERIAEVSPTAGVAADLTRIDLPGCTLIPGLIDSHVHYAESMGPAFLAAGVTTVRDTGNDLDWILQRRALNAARPQEGPGIVCCGQLLDGSPAHWKRMGRSHATTEEIRASVREHAERGVDQIKLYAKLDLEMVQAAVDEAHRLDKFVLAQLNVPVEDAVAAGLNEFEHLSMCDVAWRNATTEELDVMIDFLLIHEVVINPTFGVWDKLGHILDRARHHDQRRSWVHPALLDVWNRFPHRFYDPAGRSEFQLAMPHFKRFLFRVWEKGANIALGSDTPFPHIIPGFSVHDELASYVDAGLPPAAALRCATLTNAQVLGLGNEVGQISSGFLADLVAVRGNPCNCIDDISNIELVIHRGRRLDNETLRATMRGFAEAIPTDPVSNDLIDCVRDFEAGRPGPHYPPASVQIYAAELAAWKEALKGQS